MVPDDEEEKAYTAMTGESEDCLVEEGDVTIKETCVDSVVTVPNNDPVGRRILATTVLWRYVVWTSVACAVINCLVLTVTVITGKEIKCLKHLPLVS